MVQGFLRTQRFLIGRMDCQSLMATIQVTVASLYVLAKQIVQH
jgi:hypothetical protein